MPRLFTCALALLLLVPLRALPSSLEFTVNGLKGEPRDNVLAWLGEPPGTPQERLNFLVSARERTQRALQALGYYRPVIELDIQRTEPIWQMVIDVELGEPVRIRHISIQIRGPAANDEEISKLAYSSGFATGQPFHHGRYEDFRQSLLSLGQRRGYFDASIAYSRVEVEAEGGTADIFLHYDSGPRYRFGDLLYDDEIADFELLDDLRRFQQGDDFEESLLQSFQSQLQLTRFFASVIVRPRRDLIEGLEVPVEVSLVPAKRHSFDVGVGYSTDTEERVSLTWRVPRVNRYGHSMITRLEYSEVNPSGRITYNIPLTHPLDDILQLWARSEEDEFGDIDSDQDELGARREIRRRNWIYGYSLRGLTESWELLGESRTNDYILFGGSLSRRVHRGPIVDPSSGFNQLYTLEVCNQELGSDVNLVRFNANWRLVMSPLENRKHRLVTRAELGVAEISSGDRAELAPSLNFFAGGNQSIRGFSYQSIGNEVDVVRADGSKKTLVVGGDRLAIASFEYQYYLSESWRGALFVDGGDAFDSGEFDLNYGAGFGIHYISPVGAVRVELAQDLSEDNPDWQLHLTIGAEF
jgi:translocation and assembly module TamA